MTMDRNRWMIFSAAGLLATAAIFTSGCSSKTTEATPEEQALAEKEGTFRNPFSAPKPPPIVLAEGTTLRVRTTTAVSTKSHRAGDRFSATLLDPLVVDGQVVAPGGADVSGVVAEADPGGRVKGVAYLAVRLTEIGTANGQRVDIRTNSIARQARTTKKKDATKIAVGSGVGAAVGAIAGGGRGAAIGAAAGGGAGTGVVLATRGDPAVLPSESVLQFRLTAPVTIQGGV
jgi:hypothetical protein